MRTICRRCRKALSTCYCAQLRPFTAAPRIVVLIHPKENRKRVGTGRLTKLCIENSTLIEGINFTSDAAVNALITDEKNFCVVLYPGKNAVDVSKGAALKLDALVPTGKELVLFILDGNWFCAEKMLKISENLRALPQIKFTPPHPSIYAIRRQPEAFCFSTVETVHFIIDELGKNPRWRGEGGHGNLLEVFRYMINQQLAFGRGGKKRAERGERQAVSALE